jgi:hypothetical protein
MTQTRKEALIELRDKVKAGDISVIGPSSFSALDGGRGVYVDHQASDAMRAYNGSLDAAKALHEAVLPGWVLTFLGQDPYDWVVAVFCERFGPRRQAIVPGNPARAWLIAILEALIAQEPDT